MTKNKFKVTHPLLSLMNVGEATYKDLQLLGINAIHQLANASADQLYARLQQITGQSHDPCVWDVFAAAINEARTGEKQPWWQWTKIRKKRQLEGTFCI
ncbi:helix-hairpin-helix domain-containing protein [Legionella pneumophila serogroup 3]